MEKFNAEEQKRLIDELTQGRYLTSQLKTSLLRPVASGEARKKLVREILSSYNKALSVLVNCTALLENEPSSMAALLELTNGVSPKREHVASFDHKDHSPRDVCKKRKTSARWSEQVMVCSGTEGPLDDGYSWRKYGQKEILGASYPRAYYRCTHRPTKGCMAKKQVQRTDEDPLIMEVTYRGKHTCSAVPQSDEIAKPVQKQEAPLLHSGEGLRVKTEDLDSIPPPFSFPSTPPVESNDLEGQLFPEALNVFLQSHSPFISQEKSESDYFPLSPNHMNGFEIGQNWQSSESDLTEMISTSTPNSVSNSPFADLDFPLDLLSFDPDFIIDPECFA